MQFLAVIIAAAACFGVGAIYYSVLANPWLDAIGKTKAEIEGGSKMPYLIAMIAQIICVGMMQHIYLGANITTIGAGALAGAGVGAFIVGAWTFIHNAYEGKPIKLSLINTGYAVIGLAAAGAILGYFN